MIIKTFEINNKKLDKYNFLLIYGENEGLKNEIIKILKKDLKGDVETYTSQIPKTTNFYENI